MAKSELGLARQIDKAVRAGIDLLTSHLENQKKLNKLLDKPLTGQEVTSISNAMKTLLGVRQDFNLPEPFFDSKFDGRSCYTREELEEFARTAAPGLAPPSGPGGGVPALAGNSASE